MAKDQDRIEGNPLKQHGQSKENVREHADKADPDKPRVPADETATGQGGSEKGGGKADTGHPSQHGGVQRDMNERPRPKNNG